jgi:hypothetical protein
LEAETTERETYEIRLYGVDRAEKLKLRYEAVRVSLGMVFGGLIEMESVSVDPYGWTVTPASMDRAFHKILGWVKRNAPTATFWGPGKTDGTGENDHN